MIYFLQHGGEAEEFSVHWLIHDNFLLVFVVGGDADGPDGTTYP